MAAWFVYVVRCRDGSLYTGISTDVARRVAHHNAGRGARYTRARRPVEIVYSERKRTQSTALRREAAIKAMSRDGKLELIAAAPLAVPTPARSPGPRARASTKLATLVLMVAFSAIGLPLSRGDEGADQRREDPRHGAAAATEKGSDQRGENRADVAGAKRVPRVLIAAGPFQRGSIHGEEDERPLRTVNLPAYAIDRTETTWGAYAACVRARACRALPSAFRPSRNSDAALPVVGVSWFEARAFCRFVGGHLPSENEWEKAARGTDGREYPWGQDAACDKANWGNLEGDGPCAAVNPGHPVRVGSFSAGASPYGVEDLAGNVWEWTADAYDEELEVSSQQPATHRRSARRVVRGGSCCSLFVGPRAANRNAWHPGHRDTDLGFRCAHVGKNDQGDKATRPRASNVEVIKKR